MKKRRSAAYYSFMCLPLIMTLIFLTVIVVPFFLGIGYSFFKWDGIPINPKIFVGLDNYTELFSDVRFWQSGKHTVIFTIFSVILTNCLGLAFAVLLTRKYAARNVARAMVFAPHLIGGLLLGFIWKFVFSSPFPKLGEVLGIEYLLFNWLLNEGFAMAALVFVNTWKMAGYIMIIYISGIQGISTEFIEAAHVDGASAIQRFWYIMLPLLRPAVTITTFITLANSFKIFDVNLSLTGGGPFNSTEMFAMNIYNEMFTRGNYGYGQAKAIVFFILVAVVTLAQTYANKQKVVEM